MTGFSYILRKWSRTKRAKAFSPAPRREILRPGKAFFQSKGTPAKKSLGPYRRYRPHGQKALCAQGMAVLSILDINHLKLLCFLA
jgi:hypothetical protein